MVIKIIFTLINLFLFFAYYRKHRKIDSFANKFRYWLWKHFKATSRRSVQMSIKQVQVIVLGMAIAGSFLWIIPIIADDNWTHNIWLITGFSVWFLFLVIMQAVITVFNVHHICKKMRMLYLKSNLKLKAKTQASTWDLTLSYLSSIIKHIYFDWLIDINLVLIIVNIGVWVLPPNFEVDTWIVFVWVVDLACLFL